MIKGVFKGVLYFFFFLSRISIREKNCAIILIKNRGKLGEGEK